MEPAPTSPAAEHRRLRVLAAVRELLAEQGFRISMDAVALRAGCSKQTLYAQFGSKRALMRSVIGEHLEQAAVPLGPDTGDPRTTLLAFARQHLDHLCDPQVVAASQLITMEAHQYPREARELFLDSCETLLQRLAGWLRRAMDAGALRHDDPHCAAELLLSMIVGMDFDRQRFGVPHRAAQAERRRWAEFAVDTFLHAFAPAAAAPRDTVRALPAMPGRRIRDALPFPATSKKRNGASP